MADFLGINKQTNKVLDVVSIQLKVQINKNTKIKIGQNRKPPNHSSNLHRRLPLYSCI